MSVVDARSADERRLREAVQYADVVIRDAEYGSNGWFYWRGYRAFAIVELERVLRPETPRLGEGAHLLGAESADTPGPAPSSSPDLRIVR